jgi:hypothetical protein
MTGTHAWNTRQNWVRMTSNVRFKETPRQFQYGHSIMGGTARKILSTGTKIGYSYDSNRNVPMPGITKVSVDFKGSQGGLRETKVSFVCWNLTQLSEMEMLYMSLGKTCVVEWGWSVTPNGDSVLPLLSEDECALGQGPFQKIILDRQAEMSGCYDAVKGLISNFNWSMNDDGGFDCDTTIMSMAEVILGTDIKEPKGAGPCECENEEGGPCEDSDMQIFFKNFSDGDQEAGEYIDFRDGSTTYNTSGKTFWNKGKDLGKPAGVTMRFDAEQTEAMKENRSGLGDWAKGIFSNSIMTNMPYITWDAMEEALNKLCIPTAEGASTKDGEQGEPSEPMYGEHQWLVKRDTANVGKCDSRNSLIRNHKLLSSMDPFTCILPGQAAWEHPEYTGDVEDVDDLESYNKMTKEAPFRCPSGIKYRAADGTMQAIAETEKKGFISNILLNVFWLRTVERDASTLEDFLNAVCDGVNNACGGFWNFLVTTHPQNDQMVMVVDVDTTASDSENPIEIPVFGKNSIARSVTVDTEVSKELKAQIMYGSNRNDEDPDEKAETFDEYDLFGGPDLYDLTPDNNNLKNDKDRICKEDDSEADEEDHLEAFNQAVGDLLDGLDSETVNAAINAMKSLPDFPNKSTDASPPVLPINFSFEMDGFSGIEWGNTIRPNYVPARYEGKVYFMVTKVKHDIQPGNWTTSIDTVIRVITNGEEWTSGHPSDLESNSHPATQFGPQTEADSLESSYRVGDNDSSQRAEESQASPAGGSYLEDGDNIKILPDDVGGSFGDRYAGGSGTSTEIHDE